MISPSSTTRPIASAHVICDATENATNALRPRPVASASGKFATTPMRIVRRPATSAVTAAIVAKPEPGVEPPPRNLPSSSATPARMIGLSTTM